MRLPQLMKDHDTPLGSMVVYEFASCLRETRYKIAVGQKQRRTDIAVNLLFAVVVCIAALKLQLHDGGISAWTLVALWSCQFMFVAMALLAWKFPEAWVQRREPVEMAVLLFQIWLSRDSRKSIMQQTGGGSSGWAAFWVALIVWGPDVQGQLLKALGLTFRMAASLPTALIHFTISLEGYSEIYDQLQAQYPDKLAQLADVMRAVLTLALPAQLHSLAQSWITPRGICYMVWAVMGSLVLTLVATRTWRCEKRDRAAFLASTAERHESCNCDSCMQPGLKPAWHVSAYMLMAPLLPWYSAIVHIFVLAHS